MRPIQKFAIHRPVATSMFYLGVILMGLLSFSELEVNLLPDLEFPRLTVVTRFPNASPEEIENLITRPISESVRTVGGLERIQSESQEGVSFITLQFNWDTEVDFAAMEVREKVDLVRGVLPTDSEKSIITRFDPGEDAFIEIVVFPRELSKPKELRDFLRQNVKGYLDRVDGVALVQLSGGFRREIQVDVDQRLMVGHELSLPELAERIRTSNLNSPAGSVTAGEKDILIRTIGEYDKVEDIGKTVVGSNEGGVGIPLSSIARVSSDYRERTGLARYNGRECVLIALKRESGKNIVDSAERVRAEIELIQKRFARELELELVFDQSVFIRQSINNIITSLVVGGILAFLALILILRNLRSPLILLTVLPISLLATFILLFLQGISLNVMSLGGLALGVGMLFDSGNVVLSAIERHAVDKPPREAALLGATEVTGSITAAVLTTVIVFLPVVFLQSVIGVVFEEMALTITFSLLVSMVTALTLIPMLSSLDFMRGPAYDISNVGIIRRARATEDALGDRYARGLAGFLERPGRLWRLLLLLTIPAGLALYIVDREFVPRVDTGEFSLEIETPRGTALGGTTELVERFESILKEEDELRHLISRVGYDDEEILTRQGGDVGTHRARLRVILSPDRDDTAREFVNEVREKLKPGADVAVRFNMSGDVLGRILSPDSRSVTLDVVGADLEILSDLGKFLKEEMNEIDDMVDVSSSLEQRGREFHFLPDYARLSEYGVSNEYLARYLNTAIEGSVITRLRVGDEEIDVRLRAREIERRGLDNVNEMLVRTADGRSLYVSQLGKVEEAEGFTSILRSGSDRVNRLTGDVREGRLAAVFADVEELVDEVSVPEGYAIRFGGEKENMESAFRELLLAFLLAAVLIYMLLSAQFESFRFSAAMMGAIPLVLLGIFPALALTGKSLNVSSFTGIILLIGIVVDNAALFYEYTHLLREQGRELKAAIQEAGRIVLRPVLMNNGTTVLALLPVALELGEGTEFQSPMAVAVISGLLTAVFLSLFVIPVIFYKLMSAGKEV